MLWLLMASAAVAAWHDAAWEGVYVAVSATNTLSGKRQVETISVLCPETNLAQRVQFHPSLHDVTNNPGIYTNTQWLIIHPTGAMPGVIYESGPDETTITNVVDAYSEVVTRVVETTFAEDDFVMTAKDLRPLDVFEAMRERWKGLGLIDGGTNYPWWPTFFRDVVGAGEPGFIPWEARPLRRLRTAKTHALLLGEYFIQEGVATTNLTPWTAWGTEEHIAALGVASNYFTVNPTRNWGEDEATPYDPGTTLSMTYRLWNNVDDERMVANWRWNGETEDPGEGTLLGVFDFYSYTAYPTNVPPSCDFRLRREWLRIEGTITQTLYEALGTTSRTATYTRVSANTYARDNQMKDYGWLPLRPLLESMRYARVTDFEWLSTNYVGDVIGDDCLAVCGDALALAVSRAAGAAVVSNSAPRFLTSADKEGWCESGSYSAWAASVDRRDACAVVTNMPTTPCDVDIALWVSTAPPSGFPDTNRTEWVAHGSGVPVGLMRDPMPSGWGVRSAWASMGIAVREAGATGEFHSVWVVSPSTGWHTDVCDPHPDGLPRRSGWGLTGEAFLRYEWGFSY